MRRRTAPLRQPAAEPPTVADDRRRLDLRAREVPVGASRVEVVLGRGAVAGVRMPGVGSPDVEDAPMATRAPEVRVHAPERLAQAVAREFLRQIASRYGRDVVRVSRVRHPGVEPWCVDVAVAGVPLPVRISAAPRSGPTPGRAVQPGVAEVWIGPDGRCGAREAGQADGQWVPIEPAMGWPV